MPLILHTGPQSSYYYFYDQLLRHIQTQPDSFLYLLPVNRAVRHLKKELTRQVSDRALIEPDIFTFNSLVHHVYQFLPTARKVIPRTMRLILIDQILKEQGPELKYFKDPGPANTGFVNRIDQMLDEFCEFGYQPKDFTQPPSTCQEKYKDFGLILATLHLKFGDQLLDEMGLISEVIRDLDEPLFRRIFPGVQNIYISGYGVYTPPMLEFIRKSKGWCDLAIKLEYTPENPDLFMHTRPAFEALQEMAASCNKPESRPEKLSRNLFNLKYSETPVEGPERYILTGLKNREQEVTFIAASIRKLHYETGIPLHRFGLCFPDLEKYAPLVRNIFRDFDLPFNLSTGFSLAQSPLIKVYIQVLKVVVQGFPTTEIYTLLLSPFLKEDIRKHAATWHQMSIRMRMKYLSSDWEKQVGSFIEFQKSRLEGDEEYKDVDFINNLERMLTDLLPVIQLLQAFPVAVPVAGFKEKYRNVLNELGMLDWINQEQDFLDRQEQEHIYRALNRFIKLLDQLTWILTFLWKDQPHSLNDYYRYLLLMIEGATYNLREWSEFGVQVMPRLEIQALEFKYLYLGGLIEGDFPRHFRRDIFFNDQERQQMGLTASEDLLAQDRFIFYQLLLSGADRIYLSYPEFEQDVRLLASTFLSNLKDVYKISDGQMPPPDNFFLNRNTLAEFLSAHLKTGIQDEQISWFNDWSTRVGESIAGCWLDGIEISYKRLNRSTTGPFEGNLQSLPGVGVLLEEKLSGKPFSITALESYAFCPLQYFMNRILRLEEEPEMEETISSLEKGSLVHRILFRYYSLLYNNSDRAPDRTMLLDALTQIAREEFDKLPYSGLIWTLEKEIYFGRPDFKGLWQRILEIDLEEIADTGFYPRYFELAFGKTGSRNFQDPLSSRQPLVINRGGRQVKLIGKIDRIDINQNNNFIVLDYKISRTISAVKIEDLLAGKSLQLPVYLYAVRNRINHIQPVAAGYFQVRDAENCKRLLVISDVTGEPGLIGRSKPKSRLPLHMGDEEITLETLIEKSLDHVAAYVEDIKTGKFNHTTQPQDDRCQSYCPFSQICRKDVVKLKFLSDQNKN